MKRHSSLSSIALAAIISLCICSPVLGDESLQREVEANVPNGPLRGTLLAPPGNASNASVVIVPGSGPTDRNGNNPLGATSGYLQSLAEALAGAGIASIRIDKRGMFASAGSFGDPNAVTFDDYAADALAWVAVARKQTSADCAWLVGHSEGALVSLLAAAKSSDDLCGLVLLAAPGRKMGAVLREQLRANPHNQPLLADAEAAIDGLERGEHIDVSDFHPAAQQLFAPALQDFLIDAFSRDPAALIAGLNLPVLIVQGDNDLQVKTEDAEALARAQPEAELLVMPGMNHVLKTTPPGDMQANLAAYADPSLPLADGLAELIAEFVRRKR